MAGRPRNSIRLPWSQFANCLPASVSTIVFDAVGTLLRPVEPVAVTYERIGRDHGSMLNVPTVATRFHEALRQADWQPATHDHFRITWQQIVATVFQELPNADMDLFECLWRYFGSPASWSLIDAAVPTLQELESSGLRMAMASNFDDRLTSIVEAFRELAMCRPILTATAIGVAKPHPGFFQAVSQRLEQSPNQLCMVGDDWELDIQPARDAGWHAVWIEHHSSAIDTSRAS